MVFDLAVSFPGTKKVDVSVGDFVVRTDQPVKDGGEGTAPSPSQLFLASIAACAGYYALVFCQKRDIATQGLGLSMHCDQDDKTHRVTRITLTLTLPPGFPDRYREAVARAVDACWVKKHILEAPEFALEMV